MTNEREALKNEIEYLIDLGSELVFGLKKGANSLVEITQEILNLKYELSLLNLIEFCKTGRYPE